MTTSDKNSSVSTFQVFDINTNRDNLEEVEFLKRDFKSVLGTGIVEGSLIIISNFPPIGSNASIIDYMILFMRDTKRSKNYYKISSDWGSCYLDSFVFLLKKIEGVNVTDADNQYIYSEDTAFDYLESLSQLNWDFKDFFEQQEKVNCYSCYQYPAKNANSNYLSHLFLNEKIDATSILQKIAAQQQEILKGSHVNSFSKERMSFYHQDTLSDIAKMFVEESGKATEYGIITKKKLDNIKKQTKTVDEICNNVGQSLSIIKGKAGTGKTLTLSRVIHKYVSEKHNVRFLTYNNLLTFDVKQILRNFKFYGDSRIAVGTIHSFFLKLSQKLGISLMLSEDRVRQLLDVCERRIEKFRGVFKNISESPNTRLNESWLLEEINKTEKNKSDNDEFRAFAKFIVAQTDFRSFDKVKELYLINKKSILQPRLGRKVFIEDYYKILELIHLAISDGEKFYEKMNIKNRYDLLAALYNADVDLDQDIREISFDLFNKQLNSLARTSKWSTLIIVDECQDFHILEKEILYKMRGSENMLVASGGKEQLIRHNNVLDWSASFGKKIPHVQHSLTAGSYRQKQNIVEFVNKFGIEHGFDLKLKSVSENKGLGKIIIDTRKKGSILPDDIAIQLKGNGEVNGCSPYESILILIPSKDYTMKESSSSFMVNEKDFVREISTSSGRKTMNMDSLTQLGILGWDGVSEHKGYLKIPYQTETRVIHYESSRGLEAWSCACLSIDEFFNFKRETEDAENFLSDDMILSESERRDKYAAIWCLMAFTRPIDTLYINIKNPNTAFSNKILELARNSPGAVIL